MFKITNFYNEANLVFLLLKAELHPVNLSFRSSHDMMRFINNYCFTTTVPKQRMACRPPPK